MSESNDPGRVALPGIDDGEGSAASKEDETDRAMQRFSSQNHNLDPVKTLQ